MKTKKTMKSIAAAALALTLVAAPAVQEISPLFSGTSLGIAASASAYTKTVGSDGDLKAYAANMRSGNTYTITLSANIQDQLVIPAGVTVNLNLGAYTLTNDGTTHSVTLNDTTATYSDAITNSGTLTITATTGGVTAKTGTQSALANMPGGTVTIKSGTFTAPDNGQYLINNLGTMTVEGGTFTTPTGGTSIHNGQIGSSSVATNHGTDWVEGMKSTLVVKGGTLSGGNYAVSGGYGSDITVSGGNLSGSAYAIMNYDKLTVSGGTVSGTGKGILNVKANDDVAGSAVITGGTFNSTGAAVAIGAAGIPSSVPVGKTEISGGNFETKIIDSATGGNGGGTDAVTTDQLEITGSDVNIVITAGDENMTTNGTDLLDGLIKDGVTVTVTTDPTDPDAVVSKVCGNHDAADKIFKYDADGHYFECDNCGEVFYVDTMSGNKVAGKADHIKAVVTNDAGEAADVEWTYDTNDVPTKAVQKIKCSSCGWTGTEEGAITSSSSANTPEAGKTTISYTASFTTGTRSESCPNPRVIDTAEADKQELLDEAKALMNTNVNTNGIDTVYSDVAKGDTDSVLTKAVQVWLSGQSSVKLSAVYGDNVTVTFTGASFSDPDAVNPGKLTGTITLTLKADSSYTTTLPVECEYGADALGFNIDGAKMIVENWLAGKTESYLKSTNGTTMESDLAVDIPALGSNSVTVSLTPTTVESTTTTAGKVTITGTVAMGGESVDITPVEVALPLAVMTDAEKVADAKPVVNAYLEAISVTKDTDSAKLEEQIKTLVPEGTEVKVTITPSEDGKTATVSAEITSGEAKETIEAKSKPVETAGSAVAGDMDGDGVVDTKDYVLLKRLLRSQGLL